MPKPFLQLSPEEFVDLLRRFRFQRQINAVHMHHTWIPRRSQYRGVGSIEAMDRDHRVNRGFSDIAQHITIAPDGTIWTGRSWNQPPASAVGHNGNRISGPFMFEMIGDFDQGREEFGGAQKETALLVVAHLQKRFKLPAESLRFHNQMSEKTCPGSSISYEQFLEEVRAKRREIEEGERAQRAARAEGAPFGDEHAETPSASGNLQLALDTLSRPAAARGQEEDGELDENDMGAERRSSLSGDDGYTEAAPAGTDRGLFGPRRLTAEEKARLRPHVVNLREGRLIPGGDFSSSAEDVRAIFTEHLERETARRQQEGKPLRLLFYAHGGLTPELSGLHRALTHIDWWIDNGVYPIYFVWETGLLQTIGQILRGEEGARGLRDELVEFWDSRIEKAARRLGGERIWSGMKRNAERASAPGGGAELVAALLNDFCVRHPGVELHAVGHSAGAIFHSHFLPAAFAKGAPAFKSLHLLAPAVRTDTFLRWLEPEINASRIQHLTMFTMKKDFELADNCRQIYRKSLLYLIHHALEPEERAELLGLEESVRRDQALVKLFGLEGNPGGDGEIVFSKSLADSGRSASHSTAHGDFDDDQKTMNSVALRVLGLPDNGVIKSYPQGKSRAVEDPWAPPDLSDLFPPVQPLSAPASTPGVPQPAVGTAPAAATGGARRVALCVGINAYAEKPLSGCVADARLWEVTLQGLGFTTRRLLDGEATYERIRTELRDLVTSSRPGDVVVFQYAGHGAQVPDADADEDSGPDEALCPVDWHTGALLIDDDISDILAELPAGVSFTFFLDSCHSGGSTRFGFGPAPRATEPDARSRFLPMTPELAQAHLAFRKSRGRARAQARGTLRPLRGVLFAACQDNELAWEVAGQGAFTLRATNVLRSGVSGLTNSAFQDRVLGAFGPVRQQTPVLRADSDLLSRPLLAPLDGGAAGRGLAGASPMVLADELQRFAERLKGLHG